MDNIYKAVELAHQLVERKSLLYILIGESEYRKRMENAKVLMAVIMESEDIPNAFDAKEVWLQKFCRELSSADSKVAEHIGLLAAFEIYTKSEL